MADGLRIYNSGGALMLDGTHRVGRVVGAVYISGAPNSSGSVAADLSSGTPFYSFQPDQLYFHISNDTPPPNIFVNANGCGWSYSPSGGTSYTHTISGWCFYGVY
jgi:hypothetical protein